MKQKKRSIRQQITYWSSVICLGVILGVSLQVVQAWVEPSSMPPNGNIGAPLTTGNAYQYKGGNLLINAANPNPNQYALTVNGETKLMSNLLLAGGGPTLLVNGANVTFDADTDADQTGEYFRWTINDRAREWMRLDGGKLGIGTVSPADKLHIVGGDARVEGRIISDEIRILNNAGAGKVLTSDPQGVGVWKTWPGNPPKCVGDNKALQWDGKQWLCAVIASTGAGCSATVIPYCLCGAECRNGQWACFDCEDGGQQ